MDKMIIELTDKDWWEEFVFWRNIGEKKIAFDYLRVRQKDLEYFAMLVAMIGKRKYGKSLTTGDVICLDDFKIEWTQSAEDMYVSCSKAANQNLYGNRELIY